MNHTPAPHITIGEKLVRRFRMRRPESSMEQRAQQAFATMQLSAGPAALLQALVVAAVEGWHTPMLRARILINVAFATLMFVTLATFTARGRVRGAARLVAVGMLVFDLVFSYMFGLRGAPTPFLMTLAIVAVLALVERPKLLASWTIAFGVVLVYGMTVTPLWPFTPRLFSMITGVAMSLGFFTLYLVEFRDAMLDAVASIRAQSETLERTNRELLHTIDQRDQLSAQLANGQRLEAMGRMAGSIAHDFNNLLTVIRGYADLVADATPPSAPHRTEIDLLVQSVSRASNVTREVLDFAAPKPIAMTPIDLAGFVRELAPSLQQLLAPRVTLRFTLPGTPCFAALDRPQMERLVFNLATNARDVTPYGGVVHVSVVAGGERIALSVTDGGPGVPLALRDRIFEPFFTTKGTTGGTGLGLASCYAIARRHGGALWVDDASGGGAMFTLELPSYVSPSTSLVPTPLPVVAIGNRGRPLDGMSVILVEDDDAVRRLTSRLLQRSGGVVEMFDNANDAVAALEARARSGDALHLVVTDLRLPRGNGADVIDAARAVSKNIALVAISGFLEDPIVAERAARGELSFLPKPFSEAQLLRAIDDARQFIM